MRGTTPDLRVARQSPGGHGHRAVWLNLGWKVLLALVIIVAMLVGVPISPGLVLAFVQIVLLLWGALAVGVAASNLFALPTPPSLRLPWTALAIGAYGALAIPVVFTGDPSRMIDALGPLAALTLAAHLGRRDLSRAFRDWAVLVGLAIFAALGVQALWLLASAMGLLVLVIAALVPALVFEAVMLLLRRVGSINESWKRIASLVLATAIATSVISFTQFNRSMPFEWSVFFHLMAALLIGSALLINILTRPLLEAASAPQPCRTSVPGSAGNLARAFLELTYAPMLIALVLYVPLRLLGASMTGAG